MSKRTVANNEITFKVWNSRPPTIGFHDATFKGRVYVVHGAELVLFPISVMAAALGRDRETIVGWEQDGRWPKSKWVVPDKRCKRWYTRAQILSVFEIHWELCKGDYGLSHSRHFPLPEFFKRVKAIFHKVDAETVRANKERSASQ